MHREAIRGDAATVLTRAFTGRLARGIRDRFIDEHNAAVPVAYPELHYLTAGIVSWPAGCGALPPAGELGQETGSTRAGG